MRRTISRGVFVAAFLVPAMAWADEGRFGERGEVAITWDQSLASTYFGTITTGLGGLGPALPPPSWSMLDIQYTTYNNNGGSVTRFGVAPTLDYFVVDNLSLGAQLLFSIGTISPPSAAAGEPQPQSTTLTTFGIAPQIGYNIALGESFSFWPKVYFAYATISASNNGGSEEVSSLGLFAPFLYHPVRHFYLGLGPNVATQLGNSSSTSGGNVTTTTYNDKATSLGIMATFGGYFGG